jgi:dTDP-4-amino-4,6-dideoxy-D-galactose acyltransferase
MPLKTLPSCEEFDAFESRIDTEYFGIPSAKVILKKDCSSKQKQDELLEFMQDFEFLVILNKTNDPINNRWIGERTNAFLADVNVQLRKKLSTASIVEGVSTEISDNLPKNDQIVKIAETSFLFSRFLNDPYLHKEKARCIYGDMVKNAFGKPGRFFATTKTAGDVTGFLLFSINAQSSFATIELIAADPKFTKQGIGRALIQSMEKFVHAQEVGAIFVGTQLNNTQALRFYDGLGFRYFDCSSIYHFWPFKHHVQNP